jgi:hypothetical protein
MLYIVSTNFVFLIAVNFVGGVVWAGLTIGLQNYLFDAVRIEDRAKSVAVWNTVNAIGWCAGALLGGWFATVIPSDIAVPGFKLELMSNLPVVFFISGVLRLFVIFGLLRSLHEARTVEAMSFESVFSILRRRGYGRRALGMISRRKRRSVGEWSATHSIDML